MSDDAMYVKLPLPAEVVRAVRKHLDTGAELARLLFAADASVRKLAQTCARAHAEISRDVGRAKKALRKKKKPRRR